MAQCPSGDVNLHSQADVIQFLTDYPNCVDLNGDLWIASSSVTDISGLASIRSINGDFGLHQTNCDMANFPLLTSINGFLYFHQNYLLEEVNIPLLLNNVTYAYFHQNTLLESILLPTLTDVSGYFYAHQNINLTTLSLDNLTTVGEYFYIRESSLSNLNTLNKLSLIMEDLHLNLNSNLSDCTGLCPILNNNGVHGNFYISNNPSFCSSLSEMQAVCASLPVALNYFGGMQQDYDILLQWETLNETHNMGFYIEKSKDSYSWQSMDFIEGNGSTSESFNYYYKDHFPFSGINYYRLKQMDLNGAINYSDIISIDYAGSENKVHIFPNPSSSIVNILIDNPSIQAMEVNVADHLGRTVWSSGWIEGETNWSKKIEIKRKGLYYMRIQMGNEIYVEQIIILEDQ